MPPADVREEEGSCAVRALGIALGQAALGEESGIGRPSSANAAMASGDQSRVSGSRSIVRDAVAASVAKRPVRRKFVQASMVVMAVLGLSESPSWRLSHAIFGAAKYGSAGRPVS